MSLELITQDGVREARADILEAISALGAAAPAGSIKSVQHVTGTGTWVGGTPVPGMNKPFDVVINPVNPQKAFVLPIRTNWIDGAGVAAQIVYVLRSATVVTCATSSANSNNPGAYGFTVVELY